jgi:uncharacterized protein YfeS
MVEDQSTSLQVEEQLRWEADEMSVAVEMVAQATIEAEGNMRHKLRLHKLRLLQTELLNKKLLQKEKCEQQ